METKKKLQGSERFQDYVHNYNAINESQRSKKGIAIGINQKYKIKVGRP